ncbi:protein of unknown function [Nitrospira japonica]|uniref:Response regulatory domain-containing protein n=1 Tax=Nitrospira japonica TaxID=1325564 RepID=A0A1W1I2L7_9BACT|nr:response regulator transcription factor [Nitrospira japonica]SLM47256.1 protein of unknown function [Nitrospira japonica]
MAVSIRDNETVSYSAPRSMQTQPCLRWRALVVDGHTAIREMVRIILEPYGDLIEVVAEASDGDGAIDQALLHKVDVVLMDVNLLSPNGVETTRYLKQSMPHVVILGLSADYTPHIYNSMIAAGAVAFVRKQDAADMLFRTIVYAMFHYCRPREQDQGFGSTAPGRLGDGKPAAVSAPRTSPLPQF